MGRASPDVSIRIWSGRGSSASRRSTVGMKSSATVQQMQPLASSTMFSAGQSGMAQDCRMSPSTPRVPNSLTTTANRRPPALRIRWLISVVLPAPRKPVMIVTGTFDRSDMAVPPRARATPGRACRTGPVGARQRAGATDARNHAAVQPQPHSFVAQTEEYRALAIPWTRARATRAPAGLLARGSQLDARLPRCAFMRGPVAFPARAGKMCIALSAYSCRDSHGIRGQAPAPHSRLSPVGGTGAIIDGTGKPASSLNISRPKLRSCQSKFALKLQAQPHCSVSSVSTGARSNQTRQGPTCS